MPRPSPAPRTRRPHRKALHRTLQAVFNFDGFRPGQEAVIDSVLHGRDTLAIMPTGAGKSLCYQLPALHLPGITLVVSPLISLMKDQADKLDDLGVDASPINSTLTTQEERAALATIREEQTEFILTTPERLGDGDFVQTLRGKHLDLFVVDEAHCISQWGHDFRPSYLDLRQAVERLGRPPILALTATASPEVAADIVKQLGLRDVNIINTGIFRPNLHYSVVVVDDEDDRKATLVRLLREKSVPGSEGGCGIIYTATVKAAEEVTTFLRELGFEVARYHGKLGTRERHDTQERFMRGELPIIVATNAFGMGIDKPDIRFVVHYNMPGSLDSYYQESGRAGRDGAAAECTLLYRRDDQRTHRFFMAGKYPRFNDLLAVYAALAREGADRRALSLEQIQAASTGVARTKVRVVIALLREWGVVAHRRGEGDMVVRAGLGEAELVAMAAQYEARQERDRDKLERMIEFSQTAMCRWKKLVDYFGEAVEWETCGMCDNCHKLARAGSPAVEAVQEV
jgi:ATP-dependent DNA helicase RecQ